MPDKFSIQKITRTQASNLRHNVKNNAKSEHQGLALFKLIIKLKLSEFLIWVSLQLSQQCYKQLAHAFSNFNL